VREARRAIDALRDEAVVRGSMPMRAAAAAYAAKLSLRSGRIGEAETQAREAIELAAGNSGVFAATATRVLAAALAERGAFDEAHERLHALGGADGHAHAYVALAEGDFERAYADARDAGARDEQRGQLNPACAGWRATASLALAHLGRREEAVALADAELALAQAFGAPVAIARANVARAVSERDERARISICRRALAALEASRVGAELESVRLRLELGSALARLGRRIEARELLRPALAAAGKANRAIAQQLFLSIKTVETHLAAGYRRLGVSARTDLSAAVAGRPPQ
jgi:ATP/maltotriose-dependent transcriptional regulator MalT